LVDCCSYGVEVWLGGVGCSIRDWVSVLSEGQELGRKGEDLQVAVTWAFADEASARRGRKNMVVK
jgi:hypothetical protein